MFSRKLDLVEVFHRLRIEDFMYFSHQPLRIRVQYPSECIPSVKIFEIAMKEDRESNLEVILEVTNDTSIGLRMTFRCRDLGDIEPVYEQYEVSKYASERSINILLKRDIRDRIVKYFNAMSEIALTVKEL